MNRAVIRGLFVGWQLVAISAPAFTAEIAETDIFSHDRQPAPVWLDARTVAFIGNRTKRAPGSLQYKDSVFVWQEGAEPREILPAVAGPDRVRSLMALNGVGVLSLTDGGVQTDPKIISSGIYYRFDADTAERLDVPAFGQVKARLSQARKDHDGLKRTASKVAGILYGGYDIYLSPSGKRAAIFADPTYYADSGAANIAQWQSTNCWPLFDIDLTRQASTKKCIPYGGWQTALIRPVITDERTFLVAYALNWASWEPRAFGIYELSDDSLTKIVDGGLINSWADSPDGCRLAFAQAEVSEAINVAPSAVIKMLNLCD